MKKLLSGLLVLALAILTLSGSLMAEGEREKVTIWAEGSDNVRVQFDAQIEAFNKAQDQYQAELQFVTSGTGAQSLRDKVISAYQAGQKDTDFDIVELGGDNIVNYIKQADEDLFVDLDMDKIENAELDQFEAPYYSEKFLPYRGTTVVLAYNSETVEEVPTTTDELYQWIEDHPGRFAYNTPDSGGAGGSFVVTTIYNFLDEEALLSTDEKWMSEWDQGFDLLKELHPFMYQSSGKVIYPHKNQGALDLLAAGEIDMCPMWADMAISQQVAGTVPESVKVVQIEPAFTGNVVVLGVTSMASNSDGAHAFINYMLSPEAQNIALEKMAAIPVIDFAELDPELTKIIEDLEIKEFRASNIGELGNEINERWNREISILG